MDNKLFLILLSIPVITITVTWLSLTGSVDKQPEIDLPAADSSQRIADHFLNEATIISFNSQGMPRSQISGSRLLHYPDDEDAELLDPHIILYQDEGSPILITADKGWVNKDATRVFFKGHTIIERKKSQSNSFSRLDTPELTIWPNKKFAETNKHVKITTDTAIATGTGMKAYLNKGRYYLLNNVRGHYEKKIQETN
jgi:lipopolysaccharide export system protein LptC